MLKQGISNAAYHTNKTSFSSSQIVEFSRNPGKFRAGLTMATPQTESMLLGSVVHKLVLEPKDFDSEFIVMPAFNMRTNDGKKDAQSFIDSNPDICIVPEKIMAQAQDMAGAVLSDPTATALLSDTSRERSGYFVCPETGLPLKFRPDADKPGILIDLKTATDGSIEGFKKAIEQWRYHWQAWHYCRGMSIGTGVEYAFIWIVAEKDIPYAVNCYSCGAHWLARAESEAIPVLHDLKRYISKKINIMEV